MDDLAQRRAKAKAAGYSDAEIDEYLRGSPAPDPLRPTTPRAPSESTFAVRDRAPARADRDLATAKGVVRAGAQGLTFGTADEIEGGARSLARGTPYKAERDAVRRDNDAFSAAHPIMALGANIAGGAVTGGGLVSLARRAPAIAAAGLAPRAAATMTTGQRIGQGAKMGAAAGALGGAGAAPEMADLPAYVGGGAVAGGALGGMLGGAAELMRGGRNMVAQVLRARSPRVARAVQADDAKTQGGRRVLATIGRSGKTLDQLDAESAAADAPDIIGEVIGKRGTRQLETSNILGDQAPDEIERALTDRARGEVGRVRAAVGRELGPRVNTREYLDAKKLQAQQDAKPFYDQLEGRTITDPKVPDLLELPTARDAYAGAVRASKNRRVDMPAAAQVERAAKAPTAGYDVTVRTTAGPVPVSDKPSRGVNALPEGAEYNMTMPELDKLRRKVGDLSKLTDRELDLEQMYLSQRQGFDNARASIRGGLDFENYLETRSDPRLAEDARGLLEEMGYDPATFANNIGRDASLSEGLAARRMPAIERVEAELARRAALKRASGADALDDIAVPDDAATVAPTSIPSRKAVSLPERGEGATLPTLQARQVQQWKLALDKEIAKLEAQPGGLASNEYAAAVRQRNEVEDMLYEHVGEPWRQAQAAYAKPMQEADAFREGMRSSRTLEAPDVDDMLARPNANERARGVGNVLQKDLAALRDGKGSGQVRDPSPMVMGSDQARARVRMATQGDSEKQRRIEQAAEAASKRLKTRQQVLGGSQTAQRMADAAEEGANVGDVLQGATSPKGAVMRFVGGKAKAVGRAVVGQSMDETARILMAGAPGQMTRAEALAMLRRMEPAVIAQLQRQLATRQAVGGGVVRTAIEPRR